MSIEIRKAEYKDAESIAKVHIASWRVAYKGIIAQDVIDAMTLDKKTKDWQHNLGEGKLDGAENFVAVLGDEIVGFSCVGPARDEIFKEYAELYALYIDPDCFRQGAGSALMNGAIQSALKFLGNKLYAWVIADNSSARAFYESQNGFADDNITKAREFNNIEYQQVLYTWKDLNA